MWLHWKWQFRMLLFLIAFVGLFILSFIIVYNISARQIREDAVEKVETYLHRGVYDINSSFSTYWWHLLPEIKELDEVNSLSKVQGSLDANDYAQLIQLSNKLGKMPDLTSSGTVFMLYFDTAGSYACTPTTVLDNFKNDYEQNVLSFNKMNYSEFTGWLQNETNNGILVQKVSAVAVNSKLDGIVSGNYVAIIRRLSLNDNISGVYAIWMIPVDKIRSTLVGESEASEYIALRYNKEVIYSNDPAINPGEPNGNISYSKKLGKTLLNLNLSSVSLNCTLSLDDNTVLAQIRKFSILLNMLLLVFVILSLALAAISALYYIRPMQRLYLRLIAPSPAVQAKGKSIFTQIENRFEEISVNQHQLEEQLSNWQSILHKNLLDKLLKRHYITPAEREIIATLPGLHTESEFRVLIIGCISETLNANQTGNPKYEEKIREILPYSIVSVIGQNRFAVLLHEYTPSLQTQVNQSLQRETFSQLLNDLNAAAMDENAFAIGIGFSYSGIYNACKSYDEARKAYQEAELWKKSTIIDYNAADIESAQYSLSYNDLSKMQNLLESGDVSGAGDVLDQAVAAIFANENFKHDTHLICQQLYFDIIGMMMRIPHEPNIMAKIASLAEYDESMSLKKLTEVLKASFAEISETISCKSARRNDLSQSILQYIMEHYNEPDLSLAALSEAFSMSERSLSRYFKDKLGETFSVTLERLRLSEAETLLVQSGLSVKEISEKVGYLNTVTFYKAFKRRNGLTPSEWVLKRKIG